MPTSPLQTVLCRYHYDPLDRSITWAPDRQAHLQRFYCQNRLTTEIQNAEKRSVFQHDDQVLAQHNHLGGKIDATLLATDQQRSVLNALNALLPHNIAYLPYGHRPLEHGLLSLLGFNGEPPDRVTGHYHLGNGHRQFNPVLMRFNSPDKLSPFGKGGVNAYAYCENDPINWADPNGKFRFLGIGKKSISSQKAANLVNDMVSHLPRVEYGGYRVRGLSERTIDIKKYNKSALKKITNELDDTIRKVNLNLTATVDTFNNSAVKADLSNLPLQTKNSLIETTVNLQKTASKIILTPNELHWDIPTKILEQYKLIRDAQSHYVSLRKTISNFDDAFSEATKNLRKAT